MISYLINFLIALALGALVGFERTFRGSVGFAGLRSFMFISFLGALSYFLSIIFENPFIYVAVLISIFLLILISYFISAKRGFYGITEELSGFIMFILGSMAMHNDYRTYAVILTIVMVVILSSKKGAKEFVSKITQVELSDTIKFLIIAFVVLPILPKETVGVLLADVPLMKVFPAVILQLLDYINLYTIWLIIVLYTTTGFVGYFLIKIFGQKKGLYLQGFLGGFTSTAAVHISLLQYSKKIDNKTAMLPLISAGIIANLSMYLRLIILASFVSFEITQKLAGPLFILILFDILMFFIFTSKTKNIKNLDIKLKNPLNIKKSVQFGIAFLGIIIASKFALAYLGSAGLYAVGLFSGFFQTTGFVLNAAELFNSENVTLTTALISIMAVLFSSEFAKGLYNYIKSKNKYGRYSFMYMGANSVVILLVFLIYIFL